MGDGADREGWGGVLLARRGRGGGGGNNDAVWVGGGGGVGGSPNRARATGFGFHLRVGGWVSGWVSGSSQRAMVIQKLSHAAKPIERFRGLGFKVWVWGLAFRVQGTGFFRGSSRGSFSLRVPLMGSGLESFDNCEGLLKQRKSPT